MAQHLTKPGNSSEKPLLLSAAARDFLHRRIREFVGILLFIAAVAFSIALGSYEPSDPSFNNATSLPAQNWLGLPGAYVADLLLHSIGLVVLAQGVVGEGGVDQGQEILGLNLDGGFEGLYGFLGIAAAHVHVTQVVVGVGVVEAVGEGLLPFAGGLGQVGLVLFGDGFLGQGGEGGGCADAHETDLVLRTFEEGLHRLRFIVVGERIGGAGADEW